MVRNILNANNQLLTAHLRDVSRSFYLTLRVLPAKIRNQIGLAYLLARTTDTIADTELVPVEQRLNALQSLRSRISGEHKGRLDFGDLARQQGVPAERLLLERCEETIALLEATAPLDADLIREVLRIITSGQDLDLRRFAGASSSRLAALHTEDDLDDYTYRVAGCVGEFWTKMCRAHLFPGAKLEEATLMANAVRFGKGLQLVNILRDLPVDLRKGRCYLPEDQLKSAGLEPGDLLSSSSEPLLRPVYNKHLEKAEEHLRAGWTYTNALPRRQMRVRLACAWPLMIGQRTIELLKKGRVLDPDHRIKVPRGEVKRLMLRSVILYPWLQRN
jgi:farnesyl-diphosphate farnesyltransferase